MKKKFDVTMVMTGSAVVEAETMEESLALAAKLGINDVTWAGGPEPTDARDMEEDDE